MAYSIVREHTYPAWQAHSGEYEILVGEFEGLPENIFPVSWASWIIQQYEQLFPAHGETMMYIRVEADWSPFWNTKYRIITYSHDFIGQVLLAALAAALIVGAIVLLEWRLESAVKTIGEAFPKIGTGILLGAAGVALVLVAAGNYSKAKTGK